MWKTALFFFACIFAVPILPFAIVGEVPGVSWASDTRSTYVFFVGVALLSSDVFLPVPSSVLAVFLGAKLGFWLGALAITLGLTIGCAIGYCVAWYIGYPMIRRFISKRRRQTISAFLAQSGCLTLAIFRAVPIFAEASVLAAGAMRLNPAQASWTLIIANVSLALLYAGAGSLGSVHSSPLWLLLGGLGVPACSVMLADSMRRQRRV